MTAADLYLGAGGTVQLERLCLGLPGVVTAVADNQLESAQWLGQAGFANYLGPASQVSPVDIVRAVSAWQMADSAHWLGVSQKLLEIEAGGCHRVVDAMMAG
jgi:spore coat polysaccharide biosynthesis predicted glycosyltransferase SpsG